MTQKSLNDTLPKRLYRAVRDTPLPVKDPTKSERQRTYNTQAPAWAWVMKPPNGGGKVFATVCEWKEVLHPGLDPFLLPGKQPLRPKNAWTAETAPKPGRDEKGRWIAPTGTDQQSDGGKD